MTTIHFNIIIISFFRGSDPCAGGAAASRSGGQLRWQAAVGEDVDEAELIEEMNQINDVKYDMLDPSGPAHKVPEN